LTNCYNCIYLYYFKNGSHKNYWLKNGKLLYTLSFTRLYVRPYVYLSFFFLCHVRLVNTNLIQILTWF
jgi:hypothetical protein